MSGQILRARISDSSILEQLWAACRKKIIHSVGVVGRVEWRDLGGHPYTGVFKGARHGIVRLSHALR